MGFSVEARHNYADDENKLLLSDQNQNMQVAVFVSAQDGNVAKTTG